MKADLLIQAVGNILVNERVKPSDITETVSNVFGVPRQEFHDSMLAFTSWLRKLDDESLQQLQDMIDQGDRRCACINCKDQPDQGEG